MIKPLEDMPLWARIAMAVAAVVAAILLLLVLVEADARSQSLVLQLPPSKWDGKILELDRQALDEAYIAKMKQLYDVYVREGREYPERPVKGASEARRAYIEISKAFEIRQRAFDEREQK